MLALACVCHSAYAETEKSSGKLPEASPSLAFLEYLAELQKVDGKWVSPMDMLDEHDSKLQAIGENQPQQSKEKKDGDDKKVIDGSTKNEAEQ